jgi:hypothetical protein
MLPQIMVLYGLNSMSKRSCRIMAKGAIRVNGHACCCTAGEDVL